MALVSPLEAQVRAQLRELRGDDFQEFIVRLMFLVHGTADFKGLRRTKDQGSDGLIASEACSIACYGPEDKRFAAFKKKIEGDHAAYAKNWSAHYPNWRVYLNRDPSPEETKLVAKLHKDAQLHGLESIVNDISHLPWPRRLGLYQFLQIDDSLIGRDFLRPVLDDLVSERIDGDVGNYRMKAPEIEAKVRVNFTAEDVDYFLQLAQLTVEQQAAADAALKAYDETDLNRIKLRVKMDFDNTPSSASFADRFKSLKHKYADRYNAGNDDGLSAYIHGLVTVLFAQCIFGVRP